MTSRILGGMRTSALAVAVAGIVGVAALLGASSAEAQTPSTPPPPPTPAATPTDAQALAVEHELLCPLCVNERLDVCTIAICNDMKQIVRQRLAEGASTEEIIQFFEARYGPKVRADLPRRGFNLILFGWVGFALLAMAAAAALVLLSMRRATLRHATSTSALPDDAALDALISEATREELGDDIAPPPHESAR